MKFVIAFVLAALAFPAVAAEADIALLQRFAGNWQGSGKLSGEEVGNITCRLAMKPNGQRLTYNGRCGVSGQGSQSFRGTIVYNDAAQRFEARSSNGTAVGKRNGSTLTFSFSGKSVQGAVTSTMQISPSKIQVDFQTVNSRTKGVTKARVPFSKG